MMKSEWDVVEVKDACDLIVDCINNTAPTVDGPTPYKMLRTSNIKNGRIDTENVDYVTEETYEEWTRRAKVEEGDVLLTREAPLGEVGLVNEDDTIFLGQRIMQFRPNEELLDSRFLTYAFLSPFVQNQIHKYKGSGSTVDHIRVPECEKFEIPLPPLKYQKRIADIIGTLDKKIDLNQEMNRTLESIAETIFNKWFVDFNTYDDLVSTEEGEIPESFEIVEFSEVCNTRGGSTPSTKNDDYWGDEYLWLTPSEVTSKISSIVYDTERKITEEGLNSCSTKIMEEETVLLTSRATVGEVVLNKRPMGTNQGFICIMPNDDIPPYFLLNLVRSRRDTIQNRASGSTYPEISQTSFNDINVLLPPSKDRSRYQKVVEPIYERVYNNELEIGSLKQMRDTLLPKLLSGDLTASEIGIEGMKLTSEV